MTAHIGPAMRTFGITPRGAIQIGAHIGGEVRDLLAAGCSELHLIEAQPAVFQKLRDHVAGRDSVTMANVAIGDEDGEADLWLTSADMSASLLPLKHHRDLYSEITQEPTIAVTTRRLDTHLAEANLDPAAYNVLILDIQGAELRALSGARDYLRHCDVIQCEISFAELYDGQPDIEDIDAFLFDAGFVRVHVDMAFSRYWGDAVYVRSHFVTDPYDLLGPEAVRRGIVEIPDFGANGRFANQLFQLAFLYFYCLRTGARPALPEWTREFDGLDLPSWSRPRGYPVVVFDDGSLDPLNLWQVRRAPVDLGFAAGFYQELPKTLLRHRDLFRRLFRPQAPVMEAFRAWLDDVTEGGRQRLVAAHVRRGDYFPLGDGEPFGILSQAPSAWYTDELVKILRPGDAVHIATNEPAAGAALLEAVGRSAGPAPPAQVPPHLLDFLALMHADVALYCNSSYSLMAALLADDGQDARIVRPATRDFEDFAPWALDGFWRRFGGAPVPTIDDGAAEDSVQAMVNGADRAWMRKHRLRLRREVDVAFALYRAARRWRKYLPRKYRHDFPSAETYGKLEAAIDSYWSALRSEGKAPALPRWRFFRSFTQRHERIRER